MKNCRKNVLFFQNTRYLKKPICVDLQNNGLSHMVLTLVLYHQTNFSERWICICFFFKSVGSRRKRISIRKNILSDNIFDFVLSPILTHDPSENQSFPKILCRFYLFSKYLWKMPSLIQKVANLWKENKKHYKMIYKPIDMKSLKSCHPPYLCLAHEIQQPIPKLRIWIFWPIRTKVKIQDS